MVSTPAILRATRSGNSEFPAALRPLRPPIGSLCTSSVVFDVVGLSSSGRKEEYHPFGTTSWWASNGSTEVPAKRYRYTGMERDDETGLAYHGARYYASWVGRWERVDPSGLRDGVNRFSYARNNPVRFSDPTGNASEESEWTFSAWMDASKGGAKAFGAAVKANIGDPIQAAAKNPLGTASAIASATPLAEAVRVGSEQGVVAGYLAGTSKGMGMAAGAAYEFGASVARSPLAPLRAYQAGQEIKAGVAASDPARAQAGVEGIGRALNDTANAATAITGALGAVSKARSVLGALDIAGVGPVVDEALVTGLREGVEEMVPRVTRSTFAAAGGGVADIQALGGKVVDVADLAVNPAAKNRVFLGTYGGTGIVLDGERVGTILPGKAALRNLQGEFGGTMLHDLPGNIDALAPAIRGADEIVFNVPESGLWAESLTAQELDLIVGENMLDKVTFVTGYTY